jgi:signal transduction histidine kinase
VTDRGLATLLRRTFWISTVAVVGLAGMLAIVTISQHDRDRWTAHSREVARMARQARLLAAERQSAIRGFLLSGDSALLDREIAARAPLAAVLDSVVTATIDNPGQHQRARAFRGAVERWDSIFAVPTLARRAASPEARVIAAQAGQAMFEAITERFSELEAEEERLYLTRRGQALRLEQVNVAVAVLGLGAIVLILWLLRGRVATQAVALAERQEQLEEQASQLQDQAAELEEQATELEAQTEELQDTVQELNRKNEELASFSASVAHDLRSPLRSIDGFSHMLLTEHAAALAPDGAAALARIRANAQRMGDLIDGLLTLARVSGGALRVQEVDLGALAESICQEMQQEAPTDRRIECVIAPGLRARGDARLLRVVLQNLFDNAFKFTRTRDPARIELGCSNDGLAPTYYVADNGIGFDMLYADKLFGTFERLHDDPSYEGTGIGLATVRRVIERHGGRVWADAARGRGATIYFTLGT